MAQVAVAREISPVVIDPPLPSDPKLRQLTDEVLASLKYSFAATAAEDHPTAAGKTDQMFRTLLSKQRDTTRERVKVKARALLDGPAAIKQAHFGRYAAVDLKTWAAKGSDGVAAMLPKPAIDQAGLKASLEKYGNEMIAAAGALEDPVGAAFGASGSKGSDADAKAGEAFTKLRLRIDRVKCIRETDDQWGDDEVRVGGAFVGPKGRTTEVKELVVDDDFSEGDSKKFDGPKNVFATWDVHHKPDGFPYLYSAVIVLAESDDGGFADFLSELWEHVKDAVTKAVGTAIGSAIGAAIGTVFGALGSAIGSIIGAFVGWLIDLLDNPDDIIGVKTIRLTLASATKSYYDRLKLTSKEGRRTTLDFRKAGHYSMDVSFRLGKA